MLPIGDPPEPIRLLPGQVVTSDPGGLLTTKLCKLCKHYHLKGENCK